MTILPRTNRSRRLFRDRQRSASADGPPSPDPRLPAEIVEALASHPAPAIEPLIVRYFAGRREQGGEWEAAEILEEMLRRIDSTADDDGFWWTQVRLWLGGTRSNRPRGAEDLETARRLAREVLERSPGSADAHFLVASASVQLGLDDARRRLDLALALMPRDSPNYVDARYTDAMLRLREGDFTAWPDYDHWLGELPSRKGLIQPVAPRWDGGPIEGKTILLHAVSDGSGDAIQVARYIPLVKARGADVIVGCSGNLMNLFAHVEGVDRVIADGAAVPAEVLRHDCQIAMMSLPAIFGTTLETIPDRVPYLTSSDEAIERWRPTIEAIPGFRVGVCWQGDPRHCQDAFRSFRLADLAPLAEVPGVSLVSLQKNHGAELLAGASFSVVDLGPEYASGDWLETAAVVGQLDLVIAPDTGLAHLAGAMGKPVWMALARPSEWRWMDDRENSPWYPTMRIFRQARLGDWGGVFIRMAAALGELVHAAPGRVIDAATAQTSEDMT